MTEAYLEMINGPFTWFRLVGGQSGRIVTAYTSRDHLRIIKTCTDLLGYRK